MTSPFWLLETPRSAPLFKHKCEIERIRCPADPAHAAAGGPVGGKFTAVFRSSRLADFNWGWRSNVLISEKALRVLAQNGVTGFEVKSADVAFASRSLGTPPRLFELIITGWGGVAAPASGLRRTLFCPSCRRRVYEVAQPRKIIDPSEWDGSDLFIVWPLPKFYFCSARVACILQENRLSGVDLIPASDIPVRPGSELVPGPLTRYMPQARALEIAKRFDIL